MKNCKCQCICHFQTNEFLDEYPDMNKCHQEIKDEELACEKCTKLCEQKDWHQMGLTDEQLRECNRMFERQQDDQEPYPEW